MRRALTVRAWKRHSTLIVGGIVAIGLVVIVGDLTSRTMRPAIAETGGRTMVVAIAASHTLSPGQIVGTGDIETKRIKGPVPGGAVLSKEYALGRVITKSYATGDILAQSDLRDASTLGIEARIQPGHRAFSIKVSEDEIVGGFLQSGDHVDLFATIPGAAFASKGSASTLDLSRSVLLLQNQLVLAVGENRTKRNTVQPGARTVTLSVTPGALARLALAERFGKVSLAVRRPGDDSTTGAASATVADLVAPPLEPAKKQSSPRKLPPDIPFYDGTRAAALSWSDAQ